MRIYAGIIISFLLCSALHAAIRPVFHEGERYVRLVELAEFYGGEMVPTPDKRVLVRTRWAEIAFKPDAREVRINHSLVWLHEPMQRIKSHWVIRETDALNVIDPIMRPTEYLKNAGHRVIVLDPGHGGQDSGAKGGRGFEEKHAALDIARRVRSHLVAAGLKVYMTRENDRFIELEERVHKARRWNADLFVSIHLNSASSTTAQGMETFVLTSAGLSSTVGSVREKKLPGNRFDAQNGLLGFHLQRSSLKETGSIDRGLKHARFIVLRNAECPAALIECGFLSHPGEELKVMGELYREELARGIVKGIMIYVGLARQAQRAQP